MHRCNAHEASGPGNWFGVHACRGWRRDVAAPTSSVAQLRTVSWMVRSAAGSSRRAKFTGSYAHRIITGGVGHNLAQEAPRAFADAVIDVDGL